MTVTPPPLTRPPHLLLAPSWEPPTTTSSTRRPGPGAPPRTRTARATTRARAGVRSLWSRALWRSFVLPSGLPAALSRPLGTCGSCPARTGRSACVGAAADPDLDDFGPQPTRQPTCPSHGRGAAGWCRPWWRCWPAIGRPDSSCAGRAARSTRTSRWYPGSAPPGWNRPRPPGTEPPAGGGAVGARHRAGRRGGRGGGDRDQGRRTTAVALRLEGLDGGGSAPPCAG